MSVGKTSLVNSLSKTKQFKNYTLFTERSKYLRDLGIPLDKSSTLIGQTIFMAERCRELLYPQMITDRSILDVMAFTMVSDKIFYTQKEEFIEYASNFITEYDHIFYISPKDMPLEDNKVRTTDPKQREEVDYYIKDFLREYKYRIKNLHIIEGKNLEERVSYVLENINF